MKKIILFFFFLFIGDIIFSQLVYRDIKSNHWAKPSVLNLYQQRFIQSSNYFYGNNPAKRKFFFEIIYNILTGKINDSIVNKLSYLSRNGIVKGRGKTKNLALNEYITRYEAATVIKRITLKFLVNFKHKSYYKPYYRDVSSKHWAYNNVLFVYYNHLMKGYPGKIFRGNNNISRYETCVLMSRFFNNVSSIKSTDSKSLIEICNEIARTRSGYIYGSWDCSLFTQTVFNKLGINLPRTSKSQSYLGEKISYSNLKYGDLVFFDFHHKKPYSVNHVGIYIGKYKGKLKGFFHNSSSAKKIIFADLSERWAKSKFLFGKRIKGVL